MTILIETLQFFIQQGPSPGQQVAMAGTAIGSVLAFGALFFVVAIFALAFYIYAAFALMTIAKRTNTEPAWLAWIPFANLYLVTKIGGVPWWTLLLLLLGVIPILGQLLSVGLGIWWWWKVAEARHKPGWWGILMVIPGVNLVMLGVLAWGE
jgi:hypothetical protein